MGLTAVATEQKPLLGLSFLLAEDNVTNQLVASQMLKALGGVVEVASDGADMKSVLVWAEDLGETIFARSGRVEVRDDGAADLVLVNGAK